MSDYLITGKNFLVVEDNYLNRRITLDILSYYDANVDSVANGKDAIENIKNHELGYYDIILMDIYLPDIDGYETSDKIREIPGCEKGKLKIIALSANPIIEYKGKSLDGYCRKPLTICELVSILQ